MTGSRFRPDWWRVHGEYVPNDHDGGKTFSGKGAVLIRCELEPHGILQLWFPGSYVADGPDGIYVQTWLIRSKNEELLREGRGARLRCDRGRHGTGVPAGYNNPTRVGVI